MSLKKIKNCDRFAAGHKFCNFQLYIQFEVIPADMLKKAKIILLMVLGDNFN